MKTRLITLLATIMTLLLAIPVHAATKAPKIPGIEWSKCLGGTMGDSANCIQLTSDGGYILCGEVGSNDGDVVGNHGMSDGWVVKLDVSGNIVWGKCLGGKNFDQLNCIQQTLDGYIIAGCTNSRDGDVVNNHGPYGYEDAWVVNLDMSGSVLWSKCIGGSDNDVANYIRTTSDGGYIVTGSTRSNDGDIMGNHGGSDVWVSKLDSFGNILWIKCLGGDLNESAYCIQQTDDDGYIICGETYSNNYDVHGNHISPGHEFDDNCDAWIVKLDEFGMIEWSKCLGGTLTDSASSIQLTSDGGYIISGITYSNDGDVSNNHGGFFDSDGYFITEDAWVVKLKKSGNIEWSKCLGGTGGSDEARSVQPTSDGRYIVAGFTGTNDGDFTDNHGMGDAWVARLNKDGSTDWSKCLGGTGVDRVNCIQLTKDGGYISAGYTSSNDGDISQNVDNTGSVAWIVKLNYIVSSDATLESLIPSAGELNPIFEPDRIKYTLEVSNKVSNVKFSPLSKDISASVTVNGIKVKKGKVSEAISLEAGVPKTVLVEVTAEDGITTKVYIISVTRDIYRDI